MNNKMPCRIDDEIIENSWELDEYMIEELNDLKSLSEISLHDLMAEDFSLYISKNKTFGFDIELEGENKDMCISQKGVHLYAIESFASVCRQYLKFYDGFIEGKFA